MPLVALAIVAATALGAVAEHRWRGQALALSRRLIDMMVWSLLPFIAFFSVARLHLGGGVGAGLLLGYAMVAITGVLAHLAGTRLLRLPRPSVGALIAVVILANTGYLGIPLNAALLGHEALAPAIAWDTLISSVVLYTGGFAVGAAFGTRAGGSAAERVRAFFTRNPVLYAVIAGLVVPDVLAPQVLVDLAHASAFALLPVGFFILGVNLMGEEEGGTLRFPPPLTAPTATGMALRLVAAPAVMAGLSAAIVDVPHAYLVQAAMPSGINSLIVAHLYGLDLRLTAGTIAWSTAVAVVAALVLAPMV
ncbi:MAG TPA: AEC family transporter [Baekduia sp.]|nr:AEC family transporter [Baekduia sp.]